MSLQAARFLQIIDELLFPGVEMRGNDLHQRILSGVVREVNQRLIEVLLRLEDLEISELVRFELTSGEFVAELLQPLDQHLFRFLHQKLVRLPYQVVVAGLQSHSACLLKNAAARIYSGVAWLVLTRACLGSAASVVSGDASSTERGAGQFGRGTRNSGGYLLVVSVPGQRVGQHLEHSDYSGVMLTRPDEPDAVDRLTLVPPPAQIVLRGPELFQRLAAMGICAGDVAELLLGEVAGLLSLVQLLKCCKSMMSFQ